MKRSNAIEQNTPEQEKGIRIHSIFESISGEGGGLPQGAWVTFIRLQGCNLRCKWCDTLPSNPIGKGTLMQAEEILAECKHRSRVIITGGEPLVQANALADVIAPLLARWCEVQIETNGSIEFPPREFIAKVPIIKAPIYWVVDYKCPSSGMHMSMPPIETFLQWVENAKKWGDKVFIKWVVADDKDLEFALKRIEKCVYEHKDMTPHFISPLHGNGDKIKDIVEKIEERGNPSLLNYITFSVQLHKNLNMA